MAKEVALKQCELFEFLALVQAWKKEHGILGTAIYRGHIDFNWVLVAKLFRNPDARSENTIGDTADEIEGQLLNECLPMEEAHALEHRLFHDFSRYLFQKRPDLVSTASQKESSDFRSMQEWRQLALAQHYGVPTRLLDFTTNPLAALFFAVEGMLSRRRQKDSGEWKDQDSTVWCVAAPDRLKVWEVWNRDGKWVSPLEFAKEGSDPPIRNFVDTAYLPEHIDVRIAAQGSVFMCEPRGKKPGWQLHARLRDKQQTTRIRIPKEFREQLKDQLDEIGVNKAVLFPDLQGAAEYLAWAVHARKRPYAVPPS